MKVLLAKSAGFCYGVKRAVELAAKTGEETGGCWMLGDLIHNRFVVEDLARRGIRKTADSALLGPDDIVIIRSHGELKSVLNAVGLEALVDPKHPDAALLAYLAYDADKVEKLLDNPRLLKTPIVRNGRQATVGYCPEVWQGWA